jgi:5-methyltetrahydrofolate--homocysteine methyltransferase
MTKALITDAFAGVAIEQVCDKVEEQIKEMMPDKYMTYRFGIGYGDLPLEQIAEFLAVLGTQKTIGVTVTAGNMMSPSKSVACITGISTGQIKSKKKGCITCSMREKCQFRAKGERCGF